jgi:hypothetical protein
MKTKFTFVAFAISIVYAFGQDEKKEPSHDIGFNTNIVFNGIFNSNNNSSYNFIYKVQKTPTKANRYSLNFSINMDNWPNLSSYGYGYTSSNVFIAPTIGKEWQAKVAQRWIWYYGFDLGPTYSINYREENIIDNDAAIQRIYDNRSYGASILPFLGIRFAISEKLYLSAEANMNFAYSYFLNKNTTISAGVKNETSGSSTNFRARTGAATGIFVFYRF